MSSLNFHRVRFIEYQPAAIQRLAFSTGSKRPPLLAVARMDCSLEVWPSWDGESYYPEIWIPGREKSSVEAMVWCQGRLFTAGLTGHILEWDLGHLRPRVDMDDSGGAIWCLIPNADGTVLASGNESGQVRLYDVGEEGLSFARGLDKQEGRVLSLAWHPEGKYMVVGGADSIIRKVDVDTGRCMQRFTMDDYKAGKTLVWSLQYLTDHTIISGDSNGKLMFWNGKQGTLKHSFSHHAADILTTTSNSVQDVIFASGVDSLIAKVQRLPNNPSKWVKTSVSRPHTHDVRTLALSERGVLASGGVDTRLCLCQADQMCHENSVRYLSFQHTSRLFSIAAKASVFMYQDRLSLNLWKVDGFPPPWETSQEKKGSSSSQQEEATSSGLVYLDTKGEFLSDTKPVKLLEINLKGPLHLLSSAISNDAAFVAFSNVEQMWVYSLERRPAKAVKARCVHTAKEPCYRLAFSPTRRQLVMATIDSGLAVMNLGDEASGPLYGSSIIAPPSKNTSKRSSLVLDLQISGDGEYAAVLNRHGRIFVYHLTTRELISKLPRFEGQSVVCRFFSDQPRLVIFSGRDRELFTFDCLGESLWSVGVLLDWDRYESRQRLQHPEAVFPVPMGQSEDLVCVYDSDVMLVASIVEQRVQRVQVGEKRKRHVHLNFQLVASNGKFLFASMLGEAGVLTVERKWEEVLNLLPPALLRDRFGT